MTEFTPMREAVDTLASRTTSPDFGELKHRANRRGRRRVALVAAAAVAVIAGSALVATDLMTTDGTRPVVQPTLTVQPAPAPNGWVAVEASEAGGDIYLARPGDDPRKLEVAGSDGAHDACPVWSPDGTRLLFGRVTGPYPTSSASNDPELVIVPVGQNGIVGTPTVIGLDGFEVLEGFDAHPCGLWAPDGRWVAFAGTGEVWVVDTQTGAIRHLPDLRPSDLEWRPGTGELTIAGDLGTDRGAETLSTPVTVYSVSTGELRQLGPVEAAAHFTWSPDGAYLAYTGGERGTSELVVINGDGTSERSLVADMGHAVHGIGPVWSPTGDRIAYQRCVGGLDVSCSGERHEVVLVNVTDGTEKVIEPPKAEGQEWYPFTVSWSPDGTTLLYAAWTRVSDGVIAVPADKPSAATVLIHSVDSIDYNSHRWSAIQMWGRQPG